MELRQLTIFIAVAEARSFTRAGEQLDTAQSVISAAVRKLERELGVQLFDRTTHRVALSDAGEVFLPEARRTIAAAASARAAIDEVRGGLRGTVRLGTMQAQAMRAVSIAAVLAEFRVDHPAVHVTLRHASGGTAELAEMVLDGRLDLALVGFPGRPPAGLEMASITSEAIILACATTHRLASRSSVQLTALAEEPFADMPPTWGTRMATDRAFGLAGVRRAVEFEVNDTAGVIDLVRHGLAVAMLPQSLLDGQAEVVRIPIRGQAPVFTTSLVWPGSRSTTAASRALMGAILEHADTGSGSGRHGRRRVPVNLGESRP